MPLELVNYEDRILPRKVRLLIFATGCVIGIALLSFTWLSLSAISLIIGAGVQSYMPRAGRSLLYVAVPLLSVSVVPIRVVILVETAKGARPPDDLSGLGLTVAWRLSPILLICCNAALVIEAVK